MPLIIALFAFFFIKAVFQFPFYYKYSKALLKVALFTSMAVLPFITILYHETTVDFIIVYAGMIVIDIIALIWLVQNNWWKAIPAALLANTIAILFFFILNG